MPGEQVEGKKVRLLYRLREKKGEGIFLILNLDRGGEKKKRERKGERSKKDQRSFRKREGGGERVGEGNMGKKRRRCDRDNSAGKKKGKGEGTILYIPQTQGGKKKHRYNGLRKRLEGKRRIAMHIV